MFLWSIRHLARNKIEEGYLTDDLERENVNGIKSKIARKSLGFNLTEVISSIVWIFVLTAVLILGAVWITMGLFRFFDSKF